MEVVNKKNSQQVLVRYFGRLTSLALLTILILTNCSGQRSTMMSSSTRSLWLEPGYSRVLAQVPSDTLIYGPDDLLKEVSQIHLAGSYNWEFIILRDTTFRITFFDAMGSSLDGWIDLRPMGNGSAAYYFNGIQASANAISNELNSNTARDIHSRAFNAAQEIVETLVSN